MNTQELKEAIEKSNIETEAKAELIEILELFTPGTVKTMEMRNKNVRNKR